MTMENSVSFKVFLQKEAADQPEVRRFGIDRDVVSNFGYLAEKLRAVFPSLSGKNFSVHWKDADGDNIMITSDDELMIALTEMQTDVRKLYVVVKAPTEPRQQQQPQDGSASAHPVHTGVTCDGCSKPVQGFRYKCVQCPDYDLCGNCESANLHKEHFMIRVPVPITWRPYFGRRLAHHLCKSARKSGVPCDTWGSENHEGACPAAPGCPYPPRGSHGRHRAPHGGHHPGAGGHNWLETLSSYLSEWTNLPGEAETPQATQAPPTEASQQQSQQHINYLRTVGQTVAHLLDPLGIDVDIEVRSKNGTGEKVTKSNDENKTKTDKESMPASKNVTFAGTNADETVVKEVASQINDLTIHDKTPESSLVDGPTESGPERASPESEGWTVVSGAEAATIPSPAQPAGMDTSFYKTAHQAAMLEAQQAMAAQTMTQTAAAHFAAHGKALLEAQQAQDVAHRAAHDRTVLEAQEAARRAAHDRALLEAQQAQEVARRAAHDKALLEAQQAQEVARRAAHERAKWEAQQAMAASGNNNSIYPNLGAHASVPQFPQQPHPIVHHPQRHISEAVDQMISMGFTNEGGWLTQLVANQNGNITKVLDILQPVKK